jgi:hypothetical protein
MQEGLLDDTLSVAPRRPSFIAVRSSDESSRDDR